MDKNPFLERLMKDKTEDVAHSSAYAQAQNKGNIGVASTESFAKRRAIDRNRMAVRRYGESKVVTETGSGVITAKKFEAEPHTPATPPARRNPGISR